MSPQVNIDWNRKARKAPNLAESSESKSNDFLGRLRRVAHPERPDILPPVDLLALELKLMSARCALFVPLIALALLAATAVARADDATAPTVIRLWPGDAPGALGTEDVDVPTLTVYPAAKDKANGAAMLICPGGGYAHLAAHEGEPVAKWFNSIGVSGFVLKYRLGPKYHHPVMLEDVSRAMRTIRAGAAKWELDPGRIGVIGFSAGGHLASTLATHFDAGNPDSADPIDRVSSRPDVAILLYPVITMTSFTHGGSRKNLLGENPSQDLVDLLSNEKQVTEKTPPCFLVHAVDDKTVPVENSLAFFDACRAHKVIVELHLLSHGGHGFGLGGSDPDLQWPPICQRWLEWRGVLKATTP